MKRLPGTAHRPTSSTSTTAATRRSNLGARPATSDETLWREPRDPDLRTQEYGDATIWRQVGVDPNPAQVRAYILNSSVHAVGALELTATLGAEDRRDRRRGRGRARRRRGRGRRERRGRLRAEQDRRPTSRRSSTATAAYGIEAASIAITADSSSGITSFAGAAAIAAAIGGFGGAVSIGLALAFNEVGDDVAAYVKNADTGVATGTGAIVISATSRGAKLFDLTGVTDGQLDNAAKTNEDDPDTAANERDDDLAADRLILIALDDAFRTAGHELQPGFRYIERRRHDDAGQGRHREGRRRLSAPASPGPCTGTRAAGRQPGPRRRRTTRRARGSASCRPSPRSRAAAAGRSSPAATST